ncbi:zinc ribbon domain-containing protein [Streptococcus catagoni]|uniref:zinc ribbon domain-containing protein n=1 Tax=Streptococcus catagoni TaxID=2654874 RepID=UPI00140BA928|nr:hypothetical protein [Streptococcus catagoni]
MKVFLRQKWVKLTGLILGLLVLFSLGFGAYYYSKTTFINRYLQARSSHSASAFENIKEYLVWADTGEKITNDQARFANYKPLKKEEISQTAIKLKRATSKDELYITSVGRKFFLFPDYRVAVKPITLTMETNVPDVDILLNQKKVATSTSEHFKTEVKRLPLADYTASISGHYKNKKIEVSKKYDGQNRNLDLTVTFKNITVTSNLKEGELYFDDSRVGTLSDGKCQVKDYPISGTVKAYVKKSFPDGKVQSKRQNLADLPEDAHLTLNVDKLLDDEKAGSYLLAAFDQLMIYSSQGQDSATVADVFENGVENDFYKGLKESVKEKLETDSRKASAFAIPNVSLNKLSQVGKTSYLLDFSATYDYSYKKETDTAKGTSGHIIQELSGQLILKKSANKYLVSQKGRKKINLVSEENQLKEPSLFPEKLLGKWKGEKDQVLYTVTFSEDGSITRKIDFKDPKKKDQSMTVKATKCEDKGNGSYQIFFASPADASVFTIDGSVGERSAYGVHISGDRLSVHIWQDGQNPNLEKDGMALIKE